MIFYSTDDLGVSSDALGDQLGMLDDVAAVCDHTRDKGFLPAESFTVSQT